MRSLLLISPFFHPNVGGVETRLLDLVRTLDKYGHRAEVLTYQPLTSASHGPSRERLGNTTIRRYPWPGGDLFHRLLGFPALEVLYLVPGLLVASILFMVRNRRTIDTIHTPGLNAALIGRLLQLLFGRRWVVSTHTIYGFDPGTVFSRIAAWVLREADCIVALSEPSREELIGIGLDPGKIVTALTWVDQERFKPLGRDVCRKALGIDPGRFIVLFVGRLIPGKGATVVVEMARRLPDVSFIVVGTGPEEGHLAEKISLSNLTVTGYVEQERLPLYYNVADLFILPSRYREGLGRVVVEALSCGCPVLMSDSAAIAPLVKDAAVLSPPEAEAMAAQVVRLRDNPASIAGKRGHARRIAETLFSERNVHDLFAAYRWEEAREGR